MSTHAEPDWAALARSPQFRELLASRRRFLVAGTAFYSLYFLAYLCLLGFAPDTMGKYLFGSVTYALASARWRASRPLAWASRPLWARCSWGRASTSPCS